MIFKKVTFFIVLLSFVCCTTNAQIIYTDINPDITTTISNDPPNSATNIVSIDFNGDNTEEYNFRWDDIVDNWFMHMTFGTNNKLNLKGTNTNPFGARYIDPMILGTAINSSLNWGDSFPDPLIGDNSDPNFQSLGDSYVGCKFKIGNNTYYGWVRVSFDNNKTLTIKDYAYQSAPNTPINAGEGTVGINDIEFNKYFKVYPNPAQDEIVFESDKTIQINSLSILSLSGQTLLLEKNITLKKVIDITSLNSGVYLIQIESDNSKWNKKIIVK